MVVTSLAISSHRTIIFYLFYLLRTNHLICFYCVLMKRQNCSCKFIAIFVIMGNLHKTKLNANYKSKHICKRNHMKAQIGFNTQHYSSLSVPNSANSLWSTIYLHKKICIHIYKLWQCVATLCYCFVVPIIKNCNKKEN